MPANKLVRLRPAGYDALVVALAAISFESRPDASTGGITVTMIAQDEGGHREVAWAGFEKEELSGALPRGWGNGMKRVMIEEAAKLGLVRVTDLGDYGKPTASAEAIAAAGRPAEPVNIMTSDYWGLPEPIGNVQIEAAIKPGDVIVSRESVGTPTWVAHGYKISATPDTEAWTNIIRSPSLFLALREVVANTKPGEKYGRVWLQSIDSESYIEIT